MERLFVYGSLRSDVGHAMGALLAAAGIREGDATMKGRLYAVGWYPGLVLDPQAGDVRGELWRIESDSVLAHVDAYEGCGDDDPEPHEFRRVRARARLRGIEVDAWVYVYAREVDERARVESGDWGRR